MRKKLLGVDVGTTGTKSILFSEEGKAMKTAYRGYETYSDGPGFREQDAEDWWNAVCGTVKEVCAGTDPADVAGISLSTQGGTVLLTDREYRPLRRAIVWSDTRCRVQKEAFIERFGASFLYERTGWGSDNGLPAMELCWLRDHEPEVLNAADCILTVPDYIIAKMTGKPFVDSSNAGINQLFNVREQKYDADILSYIGISADRLPPVVPSATAVGHLTPEAAKEMGLTVDTVVSAGAHDQYAVAVGAGAIHPGDLMIGSGTSWVITSMGEGPRFDTGLAQSRAAAPGIWGSLSSLSSGGVCVEWIRKFLSAGAEKPMSLREIDTGCISSSAAADGLYFYPFGSRLKDGVQTEARASTGTFIGLDLSTSPYAMARAVMEGIVFQLMWMLEQFENQPACIRLAGGASKSPFWSALIADMTGKPVYVPEVADLACVGAAVLAGMGAGCFGSVAEGCAAVSVSEKPILPDPDTAALYRKYYADYKKKAAYLDLLYRN